VNNPIIRYYTDEYAEADRLFVDGAGQLELIRTQELLSQLLPHHRRTSPISAGELAFTLVGSPKLDMTLNF
jgi:hypothetical protein